MNKVRTLSGQRAKKYPEDLRGGTALQVSASIGARIATTKQEKQVSLCGLTRSIFHALISEIRVSISPSHSIAVSFHSAIPSLRRSTVAHLAFILAQITVSELLNGFIYLPE